MCCMCFSILSSSGDAFTKKKKKEMLPADFQVKSVFSNHSNEPPTQQMLLIYIELSAQILQAKVLT